ncbi:low-temperature-induced 65 kDa protein [Gastrolobium bilobum]|uniref:low-temperature-induced 65 kDa protein n=1 Tax=Gastrolobium bilobum TaxID=150636 RepID=UPI002AAF4BDB|nr:low-temperature-induced 65 kDa protein [Gastrolobium bilobum]
MAQLERPQRNVDTSKTPTIHTMEQLLRGESSKSSKLSPTLSSSSSSSSQSSPFFQRLRHHDLEEDHGQNQKKSVLSKVKEKAKKLRHSLSKKKHEDGNVTSPTGAAGLEGDGVEEDAEFHGAPMYESEKTPEGYKENASPVTPEKHVKPRVEQAREKSLSRSLSKRTTQAATATSPTATTATSSTTLSSPTKTMAKTIADKVTPASAEGLDAAHSITSKLQGLTVSKPTEHHNASSSTAATKTLNTSLSFATPLTPPAKLPSQTTSNPNLLRISSAPVTPSPSSAQPSGKNTSPTSQIWDKGVSMKEYLMNKLEPGEDEKALSQVISEAMSPRRTPGDAGVMEKVREAVTSLLRNEEPTKYADAAHTTRMSSQTPASNTNVTRASSQIPVSSNAQEVVQEENHGRILHAN